MGCIICNILEIWTRVKNYEDCIKCVDVYGTDEIDGRREELIEEICNDIAVGQPYMVERINTIFKLEKARKEKERENSCVL